jgi:hypothetical protein
MKASLTMGMVVISPGRRPAHLVPERPYNSKNYRIIYFKCISFYSLINLQKISVNSPLSLSLKKIKKIKKKKKRKETKRPFLNPPISISLYRVKHENNKQTF